MPQNHPLIWLVVYLIIGFSNVAAAITPGGAPTWANILCAVVMGGLALRIFLNKEEK